MRINNTNKHGSYNLDICKKNEIHMSEYKGKSCEFETVKQVKVFYSRIYCSYLFTASFSLFSTIDKLKPFSGVKNYYWEVAEEQDHSKKLETIKLLTTNNFYD